MEIAVIDFGGQYVFNIRRNLLEQGVAAEILPYATPADELRRRGVKGVILSGGPYSVYDSNAPHPDPEILSLHAPILGLCYGHQLIAHLLGGEVCRGKVGEYGFSEMTLNTANALFHGLAGQEICWMSHGDVITKEPSGFEIIGSTSESRIAAFHKDGRIFGLQFHPEVSHTPNGYKILKNFAKICRCSEIGWDIRTFIETSVRDLREKIKSEKAIIALSGGVDSTTVALLAHRSLKESLLCVHVDHGLMRKNESHNVVRTLRSLGLNVVFVEASEKFLQSLAGAHHSDDKRRIIGRLFIEEFEKVAREENVKWLIQGTIAPDIIESTRGEARKKSDRGHGGLIKIHHNVAGLPQGMTLNLAEPISTLFKYQVRKLARELGLPSEISERQPFPGPGFGCRIAGEITRGKIEVLREVDVIVESELRRYHPSQYFAILVNNRREKASTEAERIASRYLNRRVQASLLADECIGVKGDERVIGKMALLIGDGEAAAWSRLPWLDVLRLQNEITGTAKEICRVSVIPAGSRPENGGYGVIIRAVDTVDFMTAVPSKVDFGHIGKVGETVTDGYREVKFVGYEITTKPAATIELI